MHHLHHSKDGLFMGARDIATRVENGVIHVTRLQLFRFEPEPPLFEVHHVVLKEIDGRRIVIASSTTVHEDLMEAQSAFAQVHDNPPSTVQ